MRIIVDTNIVFSALLNSNSRIGRLLLDSRDVIAEAKEWVKDVDFDDFAFVAVANHLDAWLWTGDKELITGLQLKGYHRIVSTADLWDIQLSKY